MDFFETFFRVLRGFRAADGSDTSRRSAHARRAHRVRCLLARFDAPFSSCPPGRESGGKSWAPTGRRGFRPVAGGTQKKDRRVGYAPRSVRRSSMHPNSTRAAAARRAGPAHGRHPKNSFSTMGRGKMVPVAQRKRLPSSRRIFYVSAVRRDSEKSRPPSPQVPAPSGQATCRPRLTMATGEEQRAAGRKMFPASRRVFGAPPGPRPAAAWPPPRVP